LFDTAFVEPLPLLRRGRGNQQPRQPRQGRIGRWSGRSATSRRASPSA